MTVKPARRSGPKRLTVYTCAAATISIASSHVVRTRPPLPRASLYARERSGSSTMSRHASTGSFSRAFASRQ